MKLFLMSGTLRSVILWLVFMLILWTVFALGWATHPQAWNVGTSLYSETGWQVFWFILGHNLPLLLLIVAGNLFIRFGNFTPGLVILFYQAVAIGWTAGTNGFTEPFPTVEAANTAFLHIGLWETTAYVLICAVTLPKSLYIADTFPAKEWAAIRQIKDLRFNLAESLIGSAGILCLIFAAISEAFLFWRG